MKRGQKAFKFFLPLLVIIYDMVMMLFVEGLPANISDLFWYYYVIEAFVYIIVIGITYFLMRKLLAKFFRSQHPTKLERLVFVLC